MHGASGFQRWLRPSAQGGLALLLVVAAGVIDYATGSELRVYPSYFVPVSLAAWGCGRTWAATICVLSATSWAFSNALAGADYSRSWMWGFNTLMQLTSFLLVAMLIVVVQEKAQREQRLARTDALTGLQNTRAFYETSRLELERARRHGRSLTLAYLDLDNFKVVNDQLGHPEGDKLLLETATMLRTCVRSTDALARLGGDEFAILLTEASPENARATVERLHQVLSGRLKELTPLVTVSLGALCFRHPPEQLEQMISQADALMYVAKRSGKNRVHFEVEEATPLPVPVERRRPAS